MESVSISKYIDKIQEVHMYLCTYFKICHKAHFIHSFLPNDCQQTSRYINQVLHNKVFICTFDDVAIFSFFYSFVVLCRSQNIFWYMMILDKFLNVVLVGETIDKIGRLTTNLLLVSSMLCYQLKYRQQQKETAKHCAVYKIGFQKRQVSRSFKLNFSSKMQKTAMTIEM